MKWKSVRVLKSLRVRASNMSLLLCPSFGKAPLGEGLCGKVQASDHRRCQAHGRHAVHEHHGQLPVGSGIACSDRTVATFTKVRVLGGWSMAG